MNIKPMKAPTEGLVDFSALTYPVMASAKLDGLRCLGHGGGPVTSSMEPFRNESMRRLIGGHWFTGLDGEAVVGDPFGSDVLKRAKALTAYEGTPDFSWHVFDDFSVPSAPFWQRYEWAEDRVRKLTEFGPRAYHRVRMLPLEIIHDVAMLTAYEAAALAAGFEGIMVRDPFAPYKFGRCTVGQGWIYKVKRFVDSEAVVTGMEEGVNNTNEATRRADGAVKRSTSKAGLKPSGLLGTLLCTDIKTGKSIRVAPGAMTQKEREHYWLNPGDIMAEVITYKHFEYGEDGLPRHPTFKCVRPKGT